MSKRKLPEHKGHVPAPEQAFVPLADLHDALAYPAEGLPDDGDRGDGAPEDWRDRALCAQIEPAIFFPEKGESVREAKRVCSTCPVRAECLDYALARDERFGIFGGLSANERRRLGRQRQVEAMSRAAAALLAEDKKRCRACQKVQAVDQFHRNRTTHDDLQHDCKSCCAEAQRARRAAHAVVAA